MWCVLRLRVETHGRWFWDASVHFMQLFAVKSWINSLVDFLKQLHQLLQFISLLPQVKKWANFSKQHTVGMKDVFLFCFDGKFCRKLICFSSFAERGIDSADEIKRMLKVVLQVFCDHTVEHVTRWCFMLRLDSKYSLNQSYLCFRFGTK